VLRRLDWNRVFSSLLLILQCVLLVVLLPSLPLTRRVAASSDASVVRVGLVREEPDGVLGARGSFIIYDATGSPAAFLQGEITAMPGDGNFVVVPGLGAVAGPLIVRTASSEGTTSDPNYVTVEGHAYRGELEVFSRSGHLTVVNVVSLEDYLLGVVPREMPAGFPEQALKAQAVAARTYALHAQESGLYASSGYDLVPTTACQVYGGVEAEHEATSAAVRGTRGEVITYKGSLIGAFFHSTSGGHTESAEFVWGFPAPYLKGVPDSDQESPHYAWSVSFTAADISARFEAAGYGMGRLYALEGASPEGPGGRYLDTIVRGSDGEIRLRSERLRSILGLRSTRFAVTAERERVEDLVRRLTATELVAVDGQGAISMIPSTGRVAVGADYAYPLRSAELWACAPVTVPASFTFDGRGWGHGVGLSQWGARGLALQGLDYVEILAHYYSGVTVGTLP
jgi:stage II sporulation protein D